MLDSPLLITLLVLLAGALVSGFLKGRSRDPVLSNFAGYHVTLEKLDGRLVWGVMRLYPTGMELNYRSDVQDELHVETSYVVFKEEFSQIQAIYRYFDEMGEADKKRRDRDMKRTFHPGFWARLQRRSRNVLNLVSDSLSQAIGILVGQIQSSTQKIGAGSDAYLKQVGANIIGYVGTKYDPLLERYVGTRVVVEVTEGGVVYEHIGILKDYSADYLEVLDVQYPSQSAVEVREDEECGEDQNLCLKREGNRLLVSNRGRASMFLQRLHVGEEVKPLNAVLDVDDDLELFLGEAAHQAEIQLEVKVVRQLDWILPRSHALIRHKAERYDPDQVFDIGFVLRLERYTDDEDRYLELLREHPDDAPAAVALGQLLFQRGAMGEAEHWFRKALKVRHNLPDGGKLAERQLRYIERKRLGFRRSG